MSTSITGPILYNKLHIPKIVREQKGNGKEKPPLKDTGLDIFEHSRSDVSNQPVKKQPNKKAPILRESGGGCG